MRITFRAPIPRNEVKESSTITVTAKVWDDSADPWTASTPTTLHYRLDCLSTGTQILDWTSITAAASSSIVVTGAQNAIQSDCNEFEKKQLTLKVNSGLSTQYNDCFTWQVKNLSGQT